jgi:hypothetical protein
MIRMCCCFGSQVPRTGGIILALVDTIEDVEKIIAETRSINISLPNSKSRGFSLRNTILI